MYDYAVVADLVGLNTRLIQVTSRIADLHQDARIVGNLGTHRAIVISGGRTVNTHGVGGTHAYLGILLKVGHATLLSSSSGRSSFRNIYATRHDFHRHLRLFF